MSNTTITKQSDLLNTQQSGEQTHKENSSLILNEQIDETPFRMIGNDEHGFFIGLGHYRLTEPAKTIDEAYKKLTYDNWNVILAMIDAVADMREKGLIHPMEETTIKNLKPKT